MEYHLPGNYSPLTDSDEIRLLLLHPGSGYDTIKCTIRRVKLSDKPQYEALSYMWGPKTYRLIKIDGKTCDVRENLYQALLHLRLIKDNNDEEGPLMRILWIDVLCLYIDRYQRRCHGSLRFAPLFIEGFRFASRIRFYRLRIALPILCLDPCILTLKCTKLDFPQYYPESKIKIL
jgi:hypothetical protein